MTRAQKASAIGWLSFGDDLDPTPGGRDIGRHCRSFNWLRCVVLCVTKEVEIS
jgi:hypothetical protein